MRLNKYVALATGMSRRAADAVIAEGRVLVNGEMPSIGLSVASTDTVLLDNTPITPAVKTTILLNKPAGYVSSRAGQGSQTIYDLLPAELHHLKPIGRLDKESSGLLLLTNDGELAQELTHPSHQKQKVYEVEINKSLAKEDYVAIKETGVDIGDGRPSRFQLQQLGTRKQQSAKPLVPNSYFLVTLTEGRNRQIRRTFATLGYKVIRLHRTKFGDYLINGLREGHYRVVS
ncbi:MAG TPA: pseudouridine synthase [Candidatus Saccharimonadales bacterium]|nr:pseudouridine synthase [Candidatus Saccharimonadales bacterium]